MQCPVDTDTALVMSERQGVEIDYCPKCRGVWLDRGELDKIIDRANELMAPAAAPAPQPAPAAPAPPPNPQMQSYQSGYPGSPRQGRGYDGKRKKKGFLGDMFDF
jgi:Zn-finger nucleic acid-binding protein